ncbi:hypothetical protein AaE_012454 [Aphanomyces astaci]|uniref:GAG-pre-integrase domain-containing protein n=1 Tax=Aphanomyces astaci TaxID=112090 RepID=A0A6A4ZI02_APHAT|nr:hypothetical protein AaE_012454 [Aphanomyces astaci]
MALRFSPHIADPTSTVLVTQSSAQGTMQWHHRLGHPSHDKLRKLRRHSTVFEFPISRQAITAHASCDTCLRSKSKVLPFSRNKLPKSSRLLERVHSDVWGPINIPSISGGRYFVKFIDDFTRFIFVYIMQKRADLYDKYIAFCRDARQRYRSDVIELCYHHSPPSEFEEIQALQMDNAKQYVKLGVRIQSEYGTRLA